MKVTVADKPTIVIELTLDEAVGLNTLLRSGTSTSLDKALGIHGLQDAIVAALGEANAARYTLGNLDYVLGENNLVRL
jgi:hypothetical protein